MAATDPSEDYLEQRIGNWHTIAGTNPDAGELVDGAVEILDGDETTDKRTARRTMQFVSRRLKHPHTSEWKRAEDRCRRVWEHVRQGGGER